MERLRQRLLSEKNIFLAIYLMDSWLLNRELLNEVDLKRFWSLRDAFNQKYIAKTIKNVQHSIIKVLDNADQFFSAMVFFKPKDQKDGQTIFRPLHTAALIDQIAIISMLQVLVFEMGDEGELVPSELSRMLPSNFYGNRISYDGRELFKPWREQYHEYTEKANELLIQHSKTATYQYEVDLDLKNFFPSIDPKVIYQFMRSKFPMKWDAEDTATAETILRKLLIFKLEQLDAQEWSWYVNSTEIQEVPVDSQYVKGLPQGLPHTYFMANFFMLLVQEQYKSAIDGQMVFYVDDSVIFTNGTENGLDDKKFEKVIDSLNEKLRTMELRWHGAGKSAEFFPGDYPFDTQDFGVAVHNSGEKSTYARLEMAVQNSGEMYLRGLSRETSNINFDIATAFSDDEVDMLLNRTRAVSNVLAAQLELLPANEEQNDVRRKKLLRYKKFFTYRETILKYRSEGNLQEILHDILEAISFRENETDQGLDFFFQKYNDDILAAAIQFVFQRLREQNADSKKLIDAVKALISRLYGNSNRHSYIAKVYGPYLRGSKERRCAEPYGTLQIILGKHYEKSREQSEKNKREIFGQLLKQNADEILIQFGLSELVGWSKCVKSICQNLARMVLCTAFSTLFDYDLDDRFIFAKKSRRPILYSELRVLAALKNPSFDYKHFCNSYSQFISDSYNCAADYSLLQVMEIFRSFVCDTSRIDQLICIHKYCADTWKNGSKHLHFYTLHNQDHAVTLIQLAVSWLHAVSAFTLKRSDYFILFAACYLHDISMVSLPDYSKLYTSPDADAVKIFTELETTMKKGKTIRSQEALFKAYQSIDAYFEQMVRGNHAKDSAHEIRKFGELDFIETSMREFIARVSEAHGYDAADVYNVKGKGTSELVNEKFLKIILRLSDLMDMSRYRISDVILKHNLSKLGGITRFHWISHLITDGCRISVEYPRTADQRSKTDSKTILKNGCIAEKVILTVDVLMSQTTPISTSTKCKHIAKSMLCEEDDRTTICLLCEKDRVCKNEPCSFLCRWFVLKNDYLLEELAQLKQYLNNIPDAFFYSDVEIRVRVISDRAIPNDTFDYLRDYVNNH